MQTFKLQNTSYYSLIQELPDGTFVWETISLVGTAVRFVRESYMAQYLSEDIKATMIQGMEACPESEYIRFREQVLHVANETRPASPGVSRYVQTHEMITTAE